MQHAARHTPHATRHTPHATRHTPHATRSTPHATRHMQHATRHTHNARKTAAYRCMHALSPTPHFFARRLYRHAHSPENACVCVAGAQQAMRQLEKLATDAHARTRARA
jgi:hypothetical protein